jgi:hypothetical protein
MTDTFYIISTHGKCFDGATAGAILELHCTALGRKFITIPHMWGKSYLREFGAYLHQPGRLVTILMFDVSPDTELVEVVLATPSVSLVCGDHHIGMRPYMDYLAGLHHPRLAIRFDNSVSGAQLAWDWAASTLNPVDKLGVVLDAADGVTSRLVNVVCKADLWQHKTYAEWDAVDAALRMLHTPDTPTMRRLLCDAEAYNTLAIEGPVCVRARDVMCRDLLNRGRTYKLTPRAVAMVHAMGAALPEGCTVFYAQGTPHLSSEMAYMHPIADLVWIWTKIEASPKKQYTVAVRRGRPSDIQCYVVAAALGGGNGHAEAAGMAFDTEPTGWFQ